MEKKLRILNFIELLVQMDRSWENWLEDHNIRWCYSLFNLFSFGGPCLAGWGYRHDSFVVSLLGRIAILSLSLQNLIYSLDGVLHYFTGPRYQYYKKLSTQNTYSKKEHEDVKVMTKNREWAILFIILTLLLFLISLYSCLYPKGWVLHENILMALLLAVFIVSISYWLSAPSAYWHYDDGRIVRSATRQEAIYYFGRNHLVIFLGIIFALYILYQSVLLSLEKNLILTMLFEMFNFGYLVSVGSAIQRL